MKKTKLLCISLLLAFLVMFLPNIACADGSSFTSIQSYGRQVDVLVPDSFTLSDMDRNADEWRKLGCVIVYYYKDEQRRDSDLIATYQGVRNLNSAYSIADKLERTYLNPSIVQEKPEVEQVKKSTKFVFWAFIIIVVCMTFSAIVAVSIFEKKSNKES